MQLVHGRTQHRLAAGIRLAEAVDFAWRKMLVGFALADDLAFEGGVHARGNRRGQFPDCIRLQDFGWYRADFDLHVDAVKQWARNAVLVAQDLVGCALAQARWMSEVSAWPFFCRDTESGRGQSVYCKYLIILRKTSYLCRW
jgi:hypothetical protein